MHKKIYLRCRTTAFVLLLALFLALPARAGDPIVHNDYALDLLNRGEYDKALEQLQKAFSLFPYDETLRNNLAVAYMYVGKKELGANRYMEAAENFDHARELVPNNVVYGMMRGVALYLAKNYDAAKYEFERARGISGDTVDILYYLGRVAYDSGDLAAALENLDKALLLDAGNKDVRGLANKIRRELTVESAMGKGHSSRFEISYDAEVTSSLADGILDILESAYNRVGSDLDHFPTARVPVILYTKKDYRLVTASPDWSGGLYDGKIRLPIGGATELTPQLRSILFHEYTHVVVNELTRGNVPTWLNEGLAEYEGRREFNPPMAELGRAAKHGGYLSFSALEGSFGALDNRQASQAYQQSYSLVNYMIGAYGWYNVREILVNLGKGMPLTAAVKKALNGFGIDYPALQLEWQVYMKKEYGG